MTPEVYPPGTPSMWNTYIYADNVDEIAARATDLGGSTGLSTSAPPVLRRRASGPMRWDERSWGRP